MKTYVFKNPYTKDDKHEDIVRTYIPVRRPTEPYVFKNPYTSREPEVAVDVTPEALNEEVEPSQHQTNHMENIAEDNNNSVHAVLPAALVQAIDGLCFSRIMKDKALKLVSIILLKGMYNNYDLSMYIPLAANYLEKVFNKEYHKDFFNRMKAAGIIQCNEEYQQGSLFKKGRAKSYRINESLLNNRYVPVFYEDRKQLKGGKGGGLSKAEISINRTYFYQDTNNLSDNSINPLLSSTNQVLSNNSLSIHISSRLFRKSLIVDDLSSLEYDRDKLWVATKQRIADVSSRLFVDDKILRDSFEVTNSLLNFTYFTTKQKAITWAKEHDAEVIQDGRHFYIQNLKRYIKDKKLNVYRNYKWQMARIKDKMFYAKRNDTNWRVDHNLTCAGKTFMEVIKEDNNLVEIDIKNSQFAIHAYWMKQEGLCEHEDVQRYYNMCKNGILYDEVGKELGINRDSAKQLMFEVVFSDRKHNTATKKLFGKNFPNVISHIDAFKKKKKKSNLFSIELQQLESEIVIDNLYPNIKGLGIFCLTKHDSLIVRKQDEERVINVINAYACSIEFECVLNIGEKEIPIVGKG